MKKEFDPYQNYLQTRDKIGYIERSKATEEDYENLGFKSGLEVHQQLKTEKKLFCKCPARNYHDDNDYDTEILRRVRPTLSELGEYDGTSLMEFKTRKQILYRINSQSACTYEFDDAPPFFINKQALDIALQITLMYNMNLVGEVHIMRKQYLDGSYAAGFQRTAILGVGGEIQLKNKKVELFQLSIEEDSSREILDRGHLRIFKPDRFGTPLVEIVTKPQLLTPDELKEACETISYINRSTDKVNTGMGAARQDVNVSCKGGTRIEIKGVSHISWIPELSHVEVFRQWALLQLKDDLNQRCAKPANWKITYSELDTEKFQNKSLKKAKENKYKVYAVKLPNFKGILSHFTQPGKSFANEIEDRLQVIACLNDDFMFHSEEFQNTISEKDKTKIIDILNLDIDKDAFAIFWAPKEDVEVALETIEERCKLAFEGVPPETRKSFEDGTTAFERVLPGADRMYPDTDSA
ncbi:MAG: Glu-tRNA(Gln) amidotransferase subunit GatE, partial [Bacteroidales bacterium]|nr:Glu-tRNA(Gln) amidotransferase subunit GatE [Bacteroidales bacterium]